MNIHVQSFVCLMISSFWGIYLRIEFSKLYDNSIFRILKNSNLFFKAAEILHIIFPSAVREQLLHILTNSCPLKVILFYILFSSPFIPHILSSTPTITTLLSSSISSFSLFCSIPLPPNTHFHYSHSNRLK